mmetsp:Transcript_6803/g.18383  ORF Transcript_6803/g.18383 Transcript_6803/m.18383 type:complete len:244 (-) Transcript_6803:182-913(-)
MVCARKRHDKLARPLDRAADAHPISRQHAGRHHGALLEHDGRVVASLGAELVREDLLEVRVVPRGDAVPRLGCARVQVAQGVHVVVLNMPAEHGKEDANVQHGVVHARHVVAAVAQHGGLEAGDEAGVPHALARGLGEGGAGEVAPVEQRRVVHRPEHVPEEVLHRLRGGSRAFVRPHGRACPRELSLWEGLVREGLVEPHHVDERELVRIGGRDPQRKGGSNALLLLQLLLPLLRAHAAVPL